MTTNATSPRHGHYDAVVVGAGFSGMYAVYKLRELGLSVRAFERGGGLGGTWYWNRYPGLQCDTEAMAYSFTFDPELYRGWTWSRRFAPQEEILRYAEYVADRLELWPDIEFDATVESAVFDESSLLWTVRMADGTEVTAKYFIAAPGPLAATNVPRLHGIENYRGEYYHTGAWPHEPLEFAGKRVAVIGTGSSGVQLINALAPQVDQLTVFQRTPQYVTPAAQRMLDEKTVSHWKDNIEDLMAEARQNPFGAPGVSTDKCAMDDTPEEREEVYQNAWEAGAQAFALATYKDLVTDEAANKTAADFVRNKIAQIVEDPETARKLMPSYYFGTKRPIKADGYYETFNRDNVHLVSLAEEPIVEVTETGIRTAEGEYEVDMILFATGFDVMTGSLFKMDIRGRGGKSLREKWDEGVHIRTHVGLATSEFPNMFIVQGPQSTSVMSSFLFGIQVNVGFIAKVIDHAIEEGYDTVECTPAAEHEWSEFVNALAQETLIVKTVSFWTGQNIADKPKPDIFTIFSGGMKIYADRLDELAENGFDGFVLEDLAKEPVAS